MQIHFLLSALNILHDRMRLFLSPLSANGLNKAVNNGVRIAESFRRLTTQPKNAIVMDQKSSNAKQSLKLLRLPRSLLPSTFFIPNEIRQRIFHFPLFKLALKPISPSIIQQINDGPSWLQGEYPLGLLEKRHEKRRYLDPTIQTNSGWREVDEGKEGEDVVRSFESTQNKQSALIKRPLLVIGKEKYGVPTEKRPLHTYIPVLVITPKKAIDKRAVVRNKVKTRLLYAFEQTLKSLSSSPSPSSSPSLNLSWPLKDSKGLPLAMVFVPSKEIINTPMTELIDLTKEMVSQIATRQSQYSTRSVKQQTRTRTPTDHKSRPSSVTKSI